MATDDTRTRILEAAGPVFADKGFQAATVRDICQAATVNLAAVNYYFGDKQRLYIESVKRAQQLLAERVPMRPWPPGTPAETRLRGFIETLLSRMLDGHESPWQARLMMREILEPSGACQELVEEYFRPQFEMLTSIVAEILPAGTDRVEIQQVAFSIVGQCVYYRVAGPVVDVIISPDDRARHYQTRQLAEHIAGFSLASLRSWRPKSTASGASAASRSGIVAVSGKNPVASADGPAAPRSHAPIVKS